MESNQLKELCLQASKIVQQAGVFIKENLGKVDAEQIEEKDRNSLVSYVDQEAEKFLVNNLGQLLPEAGFLTEEETVAQEKKTYRWIIDPLDGTTNFLHQLPFFSVSVALQKDDELLIGIVYEVNRSECFYAYKNGGAFLNGKAISVRTKIDLSNSIIATGFPYYDFTNTDKYLAILKQVILKSRGVRRFGSAALDLAYVSCGRFDSFYEITLNAWDVAAGIVLVREAGGLVNDFKGGEDYLFGAEIVASAPDIHHTILDIIREEYV